MGTVTGRRDVHQFAERRRALGLSGGKNLISVPANQKVMTSARGISDRLRSLTVCKSAIALC